MVGVSTFPKSLVVPHRSSIPIQAIMIPVGCLSVVFEKALGPVHRCPHFSISHVEAVTASGNSLCLYICTPVYIYSLYIYRERERERIYMFTWAFFFWGCVGQVRHGSEFVALKSGAGSQNGWLRSALILCSCPALFESLINSLYDL